MTEFALKREVTPEHILLHELIHRINNEFSSLIGAVSLEDLFLSISRSKLDDMKIDLVLTASPLRLPSDGVGDWE